MITMHRLLPLALLAALLSLTGCAALSPYSDMTKLDLTLNGSDELISFHCISAQKKPCPRTWWCSKSWSCALASSAS